MPNYAIFGGCLASDLEFPNLPLHSGGRADWVLRQVSSLPLAGSGAFLGEDKVPGGMHARLFRLADGFRLVYNDTGTFDIPNAGTEIFWHPNPDADMDAARLDVIGYGFATMHHAAGTICLHGSAVALGAGGIAFMAPKGFGKSTLARALTNAGSRLATDDAVVVTRDRTPMLRPGVHEFRLRDDSANRLAHDGQPGTEGYGGKRVVTNIEKHRLMLDPVPLSALYLLAPVKPDADRASVRRVALSPVQATVSLVHHLKGGALLGGSERAVTLDRVGDLAMRTPVYRLEVARDFDRLDEVVQQLLDWHGGAVVEPLAASAA